MIQISQTPMPYNYICAANLPLHFKNLNFPHKSARSSSLFPCPLFIQCTVGTRMYRKERWTPVANSHFFSTLGKNTHCSIGFSHRPWPTKADNKAHLWRFSVGPQKRCERMDDCERYGGWILHFPNSFSFGLRRVFISVWILGSI